MQLNKTRIKMEYFSDINSVISFSRKALLINNVNKKFVCVYSWASRGQYCGFLYSLSATARIAINAEDRSRVVYIRCRVVGETRKKTFNTHDKVCRLAWSALQKHERDLLK